MEQNQHSPEDELAAVKKDLHTTRSRLLGLSALVYSAVSPDGDERSRVDKFDRELEGLMIDLKRFFDAAEPWMPKTPPIDEPPELPGETPEPGGPLPPAVQSCVMQRAIDLKACKTNSNPEECEARSIDRYQQCMEAVVLAEPYSPSDWSAPPIGRP